MMKQRIYLILMVSFMLLACQKSEYREVEQYTIEQFMNIISIGGSSFSADESTILFSSNQSGIYNAYSIPVEGGQPTQITNSTDNAILPFKRS